MNEFATGEKCGIGTTDPDVADSQCDGLKFCFRFTRCIGVPRPVKDETYSFNETETGSLCPAGRPFNDYFCDGNRRCDNFVGRCYGVARPVKDESYFKTEDDCTPSNPLSGYSCDGLRTCNPISSEC